MVDSLKLARAAIAQGMLRVLRELLARDAKLAKNAQLIVDCARHFRADALDLLLKHGADINSQVRGYGVLHAAIQEEAHGENVLDEAKRLPFLRHVLTRGGDPEAKSRDRTRPRDLLGE